MASIWIKILECFDNRNLVLQSRKVSNDKAAENIKELSVEMQVLRDNWPKILSESSLVADGMNMSPEWKEDRRKRAPLKKIEEYVISPEGKFKRDVFLPILDNTIAQRNQRFKGLVDIPKFFHLFLILTV